MRGITANGPGLGEAGRQMAERAMRRIRDTLATNQDETIEVIGEIGENEPLILPREILALFAQLLGFLANGQLVQIIPDNAMMTTQQAADLLNVSRPYLIGLLERDAIPYTKVGTHRRIAFKDLMDYKRQDDQRRRAVVDQLAELGEELGED